MMKPNPKPLCDAIRLGLLAFVVPLCAIGAPQGEEARDGSEATRLDELKVTARKVEESIQEIPLAVTAFSSERIERLGLESINDIARLTPGFSFRSAFGREGDRPVIRGMSNIQGEPNAAFFIDGVFVAGNLSGFALDNLERVEVIKGPQAALFGRRTFSGAVNFITKAPTNEPRGKVSLTAATDSERELSGNYSGALVDDLVRFQANMRYYRFGGQYRNPATGIKDLGGQQSVNFGTTLYFTPTESLDAQLRLNYSEDQDEHYPLFRQGSSLNNCFLPRPTGTTFAGLPVMQGRERGFFCGTVRVPTNVGINTNVFEAAGIMPGLQRSRWRSNLTVNWTAPNGWTLTSLSAFNTTRGESNIDQDFSTVRGFGGAFETYDKFENRDYSQELRITTDQTQPLRGLFGLYFYKEEPRPGLTGNLSGVVLQPNGTVNRFPTLVPTFGGTTVTNQAVFGMVEWEFAPAWTASFEARYAEDKIRLSGRSTATVRPFGAPATTPLGVRFFSKSKTFDNFLPRATLKYDLSDDAHVYGLIAKGNKPGGFNAAVESANLTEAGRQQLIQRGFESFDEEEAWNYELGYKSTWMDRALRFNASLFYIDWDNQQLTQTQATERIDSPPPPATPVFFITSYTANLGKSRVWGAELELDYQVNDQLNVFAAYSRQDSKIKRFCSPDLFDLFGNCNAAGKRLPRVPLNTLILGGTFGGALQNGWNWYVGGDLNYESSRYSQIENLNETGGSTRINLRAGFDLGREWSVVAFVRNATDEDAAEDILRYVDPLVSIRVPALNPDGTVSTTRTEVTSVRDFAITAPRKRQVGINVVYRF